MSRPTPQPEPPSWQAFLTRDLLEDIVGPAVYARGQDVLAQGRVTSFEATAEGLVGGVSKPPRGIYRVWMTPDAEGFLGGCECPFFYREAYCKHMVALALAWLRQEVQPPTPPSAPAPLGQTAKTPAKDAEAGLPRTPEALQAWLEANHVTHARQAPFAALVPYLPKRFGSRYLFLSFAGSSPVGLLDGSLRMQEELGDPSQREKLEATVWRWLQAEVERVRQGLEREESAPPRRPPTDERLAPLVEALERTRAQVREHAPPRYLGEDAPTVTLKEQSLFPFKQEHPVFHLQEVGRVALFPSAGPPVLSKVELDPRAVLDGAGGVSCSCMPGKEARCVHALTALDAVLERLTKARHARANRRLAELLFVVPGQRILAALERVAAAQPPRPVGALTSRVSFRLSQEEGESGLELRPYLQRPLKKGGGLSKGTPVLGRDMDEARAALPDTEEQEALELFRPTGYSLTPAEAHRRRVRALRLLARSPHLVLDTRPDTPLRVREAPLGLSFEQEDGALRVCPSVEGRPVAPGALHPPPPQQTRQPWVLLEPEVPRVTLVTVPPQAGPVLDALRVYGMRLPASAREAVLRHLAGLEAVFPVSLPESMEARPVEPAPGLLLRVRPAGTDTLEVAMRVRPLPEAAPLPPGEGAPVVRGVRGGERVMVRRNLVAERAEAEAVREKLGLPQGEAGAPVTLEGAEAALGFLEKVEPLQGPGLRVEWEERAWSVGRLDDAAGLKVRVERGHDWFGVEGGVEVDGERVELAVLMDALRRNRRYVPLGPGRWLRLTESLRERLGPLADLAHATRHGLEVSAAAAPVLDALEAAGAEVHAPPDWRHLAGRIREAQARKVPVPRTLKAKLRDYQREGFVWMARLAEWGGGGCLADDMGLGKTLQTLALLLHRAKEGPALVVAPTSVCFNWVHEAARFAPSLRVHSYREAEREALLGALEAGDVLVVSYGLLVQDAERFAQVSFATLVVDEAQAVKNPDTARAKALRGLEARARVALTGTPVENRLSELWSLFQIVFPGLLGSREAFRQRFAAPIERDRDAQARASLARVVRPFLLRRTKAQVAKELPPRIETVVPVALSEEERRMYEDARLAALAKLSDAGPEKRFELLAALTRLRLLACHPRLGDADSEVPSSKLERFLERLAELRAEGGRALVFSQFVRHLALVREALEARGVPFQYLDGQTPAAEREARVAAFQRGEGDVFLISVKAGGTGLNLTAADHVIHLDPWWNPAVEDQATDRAHRIGQKRTVTVSRLVSEGTIEEAILALHAEKRDLANSLLSEADGAAALSTDQLLALLRFTA